MEEEENKEGRILVYVSFSFRRLIDEANRLGLSKENIISILPPLPGVNEEYKLVYIL